MENELKLTAACKASSDGKGFIGFVLEKPGVISQGDTMEMLMANLEEAYNCMVAYEKQEMEKFVPSFMLRDNFVNKELTVACV